MSFDRIDAFVSAPWYIECGGLHHTGFVPRSPAISVLTHKLSSVASLQTVYNLCIKSLLQCGNFAEMVLDRLPLSPFLPTMKLQLSQLPMIVGSGRVAIRRALFSCAPHFNSIT
jgi:hypothetical protein